MMINFTFTSAGNIIFGPGTMARAAVAAAGMGRHVLLVTGGHPARAAGLARILENEGTRQTLFSVAGEQEIGHVAAGAALVRDKGCELVIGFGGGSVLDAAKAIAALATNTLPVETYLEVIGEGRPLYRHPHHRRYRQ